MAEPAGRFYDSQGLRLHYADWGNETAPPLILIHGGLDHCRIVAHADDEPVGRRGKLRLNARDQIALFEVGNRNRRAVIWRSRRLGFHG